MTESLTQAEERIRWGSLRAWGTIVGLIGGIVGLLGGGASLYDRWMPPSLEVLECHPVFLWKPIRQKIGGDEVRTAKRGVAVMIRVRSGNCSISVTGIEYSGDLLLSVDEWIGFFGRDGMTLEEEEAEYTKARPYLSVAFTGWLADSVAPVRLEPHEELYLRFVLIDPNATGTSGLLIDKSYIGSSGQNHPRAPRRFWPRPLDFFTPKPHPDGWMARDMRDEVREGGASFTIVAGGRGILIPAAAIRSMRIIDVDRWGHEPTESFLSALP